ncbi:MAG: tetratricopeptide repeat protein [Comamonadaceae bacterium]|nr:tetratricopeptide repeat protein [Comamonadaceae bacterium]
MAQSEPTLNQVYATAKEGKLEQAQLMIQQVLIAHPNSAKAFFVRSELYARQGDLPRARESLATAEKLAPGLPFAKADAVQNLRSQLAAPKAGAGLSQHKPAPVAPPMSAPPAPSSSSWAIPLLLAGGVIALGYFLFRKKKPAPFAQQPPYASPGGLSGPQSFGVAGGAGGYGAMQPTYGQPGYGQPGYGQPAGSGLGGRIMGGVATGMAVGAGVVAAQAIGRNLMGNHDQPAGQVDKADNNQFQPLGGNTDMGGQDFGISDTSSWDDGGGVDTGGDWDNN